LNSNYHYIFVPILTRINSEGELLGSPTEIFPQNYLSENCNRGDSTICIRVSASIGSETIVYAFMPCPGICYGSSQDSFLMFLQTLDLDGRLIGEPCVFTGDDYGIKFFKDYDYVIGIEWDGEGYGIALTGVDEQNQPTIFFLRYLPE